MFNLQNKVALVTGARRGMGKSHAFALASQGAKVIVTDIDAKECAVVVEKTKRGGSDPPLFVFVKAYAVAVKNQQLQHQ